jgi:phosphatidylinositol glycan class U
VAKSDRYLFNPLTIATCIGRPTSVFTNCAILFALANAIENRPIKSILALSLASYLSLYPALLLPPLILLCHDRQTRTPGRDTNGVGLAIICLGAFTASIGLLLTMSYFVTGTSWEFLSSTYGVQLLLPDLTPNIGLWWYFFIEMFDSFREFFLGVFWLHLAGYVGGLCFRVHKQPLFAITTMIGIFAIFKPYPSISDTSLYCALLPLYRHVFGRRLVFTFAHHKITDMNSYAIYIFLRRYSLICHTARSRILLPLDIRRFWQRELLLRHHLSMESRFDLHRGRFVVCSSPR